MRKVRACCAWPILWGGKIGKRAERIFVSAVGLLASEGVLVGGQKVASEVGLAGSLFGYSALEETLVGGQVLSGSGNNFAG